MCFEIASLQEDAITVAVITNNMLHHGLRAMQDGR